jgi:hypothetical protein
MRKVCFDVSKDMTDRVRVVQEQLGAESGSSYSMDGMLREQSC